MISYYSRWNEREEKAKSGILSFCTNTFCEWARFCVLLLGSSLSLVRSFFIKLGYYCDMNVVRLRTVVCRTYMPYSPTTV